MWNASVLNQLQGYLNHLQVYLKHKKQLEGQLMM